jgi:hypothetical protein
VGNKMREKTADQYPHGALRVSSVKNRFPECSAYLLNTAGAKTRQVALWEIPLSAEIQIPPEQLSVEHFSYKEQ